MPRILIFNANRRGIGTYHRALNFGRALSRHGHDVTLMTVSMMNRFQSRRSRDDSGMEIVECPCLLDEMLPWHASGPLDILARLSKSLRHSPDLIYAFEYQPNVSIPTYFNHYLLGRRFISDWCDWHAGASYHFGGKTWAHRIDRLFEESIRYPARFVTVINSVLRDRAVKMGINANRVSIIWEGVDTEYMAPFEQSGARTRLGLPATVPIVGAIKDSPAGHQLLVEAVARIKSHGHDVKLIIIGREPGGARKRASELGVERSLILPGRVSDTDMPLYLASCDVLALPLEDNLVNRGRWPHKLGDMVSCGKPVVASIAGEFPERLARANCIRSAAFSATSFAEAIEDLLESEDERTRLGKAGRQFAVETLDWTMIYPQVTSLVEQALQ